MKYFHVTFKPDDKRLSIHEGATLVEAAGQAGIILNTVCGGEGTCRKCAVKVEPTGQEVLACQYRVDNDMTVFIPPGARLFRHKILTDSSADLTTVKPTVYKKYIGPRSEEDVFGVSVDIGTTTVVAKLVNMVNNELLATEAVVNPQVRFGDDVISRIAFLQSRKDSDLLQKEIIACLNELIAKLCRQALITPENILELAVVGNTAMNHIFLGLPVEQLGQAPYKAYSLDAHDVPPDRAGLLISPRGNVHTVENISGFVGSDTVTVALAVDIESACELTLIVDIGTNGEIVLGTEKKLYAASCAAGPALEGARITCGSRAAEGAIEAIVTAGDDIDIDVIGQGPARSICGSGLIDAVAVLLDLGVIDQTGRFVEPQNLSALSEELRRRISPRQGLPAFTLAWSPQQGGQDVFLTQQDIRQVQLAKGAIRAGCALLQRKLSVPDSMIEKIFLAGAFGNYIRPASAVRIGLLPEVPLERIQSIGNAASLGACMVLVSEDCRQKCARIARKIEYTEIASEPDFAEVYADSMLF